MVRQVIRGFERRATFEEVVYLEKNDREWAEPFFASWHEKAGEIFYFIESDTVIQDDFSQACWTDRFQAVMDANPKLAMVGSAIDRTDFADAGDLEQRLGRPLAREEQDQIKLLSVERTMPAIGSGEVVSPFNPPGRLLALRTRPVQLHLGTVMQWTDDEMHRILINNGWETGIFGGVVHRHLSLLNYFDYPDYSMEARDQYTSPT